MSFELYPTKKMGHFGLKWVNYVTGKLYFARFFEVGEVNSATMIVSFRDNDDVVEVSNLYRYNENCQINNQIKHFIFRI